MSKVEDGDGDRGSGGREALFTHDVMGRGGWCVCVGGGNMSCHVWFA